MLQLPLAEIVELAAALIAVGALAGFLAGLFGVGGGAILVPVLYELFRIMDVPLEARMPLCVGTSLAIIIPTAIRSYLTHRRHGNVDMDILRKWAIPVVIGVTAGSVIARYAPEQVFKYVFVAVAWSGAFRLILGKDSWRLQGEFPTGAWMKLYGVFIGLLSTLMGIGGGLFSNLLMTLYGKSIHTSVATSSGLAVLISIPGTLGYIYAGWPVAAKFPTTTVLQFPLAIGYISLLGAIMVMPTSLLTAPFGARAAHAMSKRRLEVSFGVYLFIMGSRFVVALIYK
jgi:uncharacterized membrane protein YfcA